MKKIVLLSLLFYLSFGNFTFAQLASWDVNGVVVADGIGIDESSSPYSFTSPSRATHITDAKLTLSASVNPTTSASQYGCKVSVFPTTLSTAIAAGHYIQVSITVESGYSIDFSDIVMKGQTSGTGWDDVAFMSEIAGYTDVNALQEIGSIQDVTGGFDTDASGWGSPIDLSGSGYQGVTGTTTFRIYGWNATSGAGTNYIRSLTGDDFIINGEVKTIGLWKTDAATTDWATGSNWDDGNVPISGTNVSIPTGADRYPVISGDASTPSACNNLTIASGASVTIPVDKALTVSGILTNSAGNTGLVIKSTATGQGSLIHSTASVNGTVERQITGWTDNDDGWHLLGSPVATFDIDGSEFDPGDASNTDNDLYSWNESTHYWMNYKADGGPTQIIPGTGYLTAWKVTDTKNFTGSLNVANIPLSNLSADDERWHLLGNPFACALDWSAGTWAITDVSVPQVYKESDANYYPVNTGAGGTANIIPSTQGFFVQVADADNSITIPADARVHNAQDWYKQANELENTLKLKLSGGNNSFCDYTLLTFNDDATEEYDIEFDSHKLFGMPSAPQLYTLSILQDEFSYNIIPTFNSEKLVPLNIKVPSAGDYTINVELNNVIMEGDIYLEDLLTNKLTNLSDINHYTFQANQQNDPGRFILHFNGTFGINEAINNQRNTVLIYGNNNAIYVKSMNGDKLSGVVVVRNIIGQIVCSQQLTYTSSQRINTNLKTGIYIVSVERKNGNVISEKVIIK